MDRYDLLYELYESFDTDGLRDHQRFIDVFPPVDSRVALEGYQEIATKLDGRKDEIRDAFQYGETPHHLPNSTMKSSSSAKLENYHTARYSSPPAM